MQELKELASSDPEKFKEVAQQISDKLTEAAGSSTDSKAAKMMTEMAGQFASAASSGSMSSFSMPEPPTGSGAQGQAAAQYAKQSGANPMEQVDSIISDALSGVGSTSA
jgi:HSP90 family molecular chaperone